MAVSEKVMRIIQKSIALATNNSNEHEAQAAMLKAQELMAKHGLSMSDLDVEIPGYTNTKEAVETFATQPTKLQWWHKDVAGVIADNFRCYTYWRTSWQFKGRSRLIFMGLKEDTLLAKELYAFAVKAIEFCSISYLDREGIEGLSLRTKVRNDYISGFIMGLRAKFKEQVQQNDWGLVLVKDALVVQKYEEKKLKTDEPSMAGRLGDTAAMAAGYQDGKSMNDNKTKKLK